MDFRIDIEKFTYINPFKQQYLNAQLFLNHNHIRVFSEGQQVVSHFLNQNCRASNKGIKFAFIINKGVNEHTFRFVLKNPSDISGFMGRLSSVVRLNSSESNDSNLDTPSKSIKNLTDTFTQESCYSTQNLSTTLDSPYKTYHNLANVLNPVSKTNMSISHQLQNNPREKLEDLLRFQPSQPICIDLCNSDSTENPVQHGIVNYMDSQVPKSYPLPTIKLNNDSIKNEIKPTWMNPECKTTSVSIQTDLPMSTQVMYPNQYEMIPLIVNQVMTGITVVFKEMMQEFITQLDKHRCCHGRRGRKPGRPSKRALNGSPCYVVKRRPCLRKKITTPEKIRISNNSAYRLRSWAEYQSDSEPKNIVASTLDNENDHVHNLDNLQPTFERQSCPEL